MRRPALVFTACVAIAIVTAAATAGAQSIEQQLKDRLLGTGSNTNNINNTNLNERDASSGVKEALAQGVDRAIRQLGKPDGFFRDQAVKILVPEKIRKLADLARFDPIIEDEGPSAEIPAIEHENLEDTWDDEGFNEPAIAKSVSTETIDQVAMRIMAMTNLSLDTRLTMIKDAHRG